jgi:hypothetical protein
MLRENDVKFRGKCRIVETKMMKSRHKKSGKTENCSDEIRDDYEIEE